MNIGIIGLGNMGTALFRSIITSEVFDNLSMYIYDTDNHKVSQMKDYENAFIEISESEVVQKSDVIILAVKPDVIESTLNNCKDEFTVNKILVSVAVGVPIKFYKSILGPTNAVVRTMPNTPALVGEGMTIVCPDKIINREQLETVVKLFNTVGAVEIMEEKFMNQVAALTGSSPAYVFMLIEAMTNAAVMQGIPTNVAYPLASQAILGSAKMVLESKLHPADLKDKVCSPGGTTIEAVYTLEKEGFRYAIMKAMDECTKKAIEISKKFE